MLYYYDYYERGELAIVIAFEKAIGIFVTGKTWIWRRQRRQHRLTTTTNLNGEEPFVNA